MMIFIIIFSMFFTYQASAGEIYTYIDKKGNTVITNIPPPENQPNITTIGSYKNSTRQEIADYEDQRKSQYIQEEKRSAAARKDNLIAEEARTRKQQATEEAKKPKPDDNVYCFTAVVGSNSVGKMVRICRDKKTKKLISKEWL